MRTKMVRRPPRKQSPRYARQAARPAPQGNTRVKAVPLTRYFPVSQVEEEVLVRWDGARVAVLEVRGMEVEQPVLLAFATAVNALDFQLQFLVRQHPPDLNRFRAALFQSKPATLPPALRETSDSLEGFLGELERRPGVLDRRFYVLCQQPRAAELQSILGRAGLAIYPVAGRVLRSLIQAAAIGATPGPEPNETPVCFNLRRESFDIGNRLARAFHLARWPRSITPDFLQRLCSLGMPMDVAFHVVPIPTAQAARTLEWQKVKMESASAVSLRRGRTPSPETEIALEDVARLRDELHRGRERLFHASLSLTVYAETKEQLQEREQELRGHFAGVMASLDSLVFRQREGHLSTMPVELNTVGVWQTVDTTTLSYLFPFSPPDLDTRKGTLFGLDMRAGSPVTFDAFDDAFLNANTVVLARSGAGKSFSTKLTVLRGITRGITCYVIDPEGEYTAMAESAGGLVLTPGAPGHGLNPFVMERGDEGELLQRVSGLRRLVEVMVGERLHAGQRATLDQALTAYYTVTRDATGFQDFFAFLDADREKGFKEMAGLLRPFATGSLRHLLTDEGTDLLASEAPVTVFNLRLLEPDFRPAATLVCAEAVWAMATRDPRPRVLVVDEVWSIMQHPEGASFMVSLAKRARKNQLGLVSITQDVQDFLGEDPSRPIVGHSGRVLLQNSAFKLLLQQDAAALRAVQESFDLTPADAQWLLSCPRGDGLFIARGGRFPVRVIATPEEHRFIEPRSLES